MRTYTPVLECISGQLKMQLLSILVYCCVYKDGIEPTTTRRLLKDLTGLLPTELLVHLNFVVSVHIVSSHSSLVLHKESKLIVNFLC